MVLAACMMEIRILKRQGLSVREIARRTGLSRNTVRRYLKSVDDPVYTARPVVFGKLDVHKVFSSECVAAAHPDRIPVTVVVVQEAGRAGFWIHRLLQAHGMRSHVVDPSSIAANRREGSA